VHDFLVNEVIARPPEPAYRMERLGVLMRAAEHDPVEAWGVLNPACARGRDGELYLFPRLVAEGNYSRIGRARVLYDDHGVPVDVERLGIVLEPDQSWERNATTAGVEDPRITFVAALDRYVMTYTAYGPLGPRIGMAVSDDLVRWQRLGTALFQYDPGLGVDLNLCPNKDALLFPEVVPDPEGRLAYAMLHRPTWDLGSIRQGEGTPLPYGLSDPRPGIWISYVPVEDVQADIRALTRLGQHRLVALPEHPWEAVKIGGGAVPERTEDGWLMVHHGVAGRLRPGAAHQHGLSYAAGAMILDADDVSRVLCRSTDPLLAPEDSEEREGIVPNVVFPTAMDMLPGGDAHVFYGMADSRIGVALLTRTD